MLIRFLGRSNGWAAVFALMVPVAQAGLICETDYHALDKADKPAKKGNLLKRQKMTEDADAFYFDCDKTLRICPSARLAKPGARASGNLIEPVLKMTLEYIYPGNKTKGEPSFSKQLQSFAADFFPDADQSFQLSFDFRDTNTKSGFKFLDAQEHTPSRILFTCKITR